jgi:ribosomal protein S21
VGKMLRVEVDGTNQLEMALRRFKRKVEKDGILKEFKLHSFYTKQSDQSRRDIRISKISKKRK